MQSKKKILIDLDGSPDSLGAASYVARTCNPAILKVDLIHVIPTAPETFWDQEKDIYFKEKMKTNYHEWQKSTGKDHYQTHTGELHQGRRYPHGGSRWRLWQHRNGPGHQQGTPSGSGICRLDRAMICATSSLAVEEFLGWMDRWFSLKNM